MPSSSAMLAGIGAVRGAVQWSPSLDDELMRRVGPPKSSSAVSKVRAT